MRIFKYCKGAAYCMNKLKTYLKLALVEAASE